MCVTRARTADSWSPSCSDSANSSCTHESSRSRLSGPEVAIRAWSRTNASVPGRRGAGRSRSPRRRAPPGGRAAGSSRSRRRGARAAARAARCRRVDRGERLLEHADELVVDDPGGEAEAAEAQRRPAEKVAVAELLGERDGLEQAVARGVLARVHLRLAAREHELTAALVVGLGGEVEDPQGGVEQVGRLLVGQRAQRLVAGALGIVERAGGVARRRRLDEVVGELEQPGGPGPAPARSSASPTAPCRRARRIALRSL